MAVQIERITRIRDFRAFKDWQPTDPVTFHPVCNLVFGLNGSGKSTVAELLAQMAVGSNWDHGLTLQLSDGSTISNAAHAKDFPIRVFNRTFIKENLQFDAPEGPKTPALLILGKEAKDKENRLKAARVALNRAVESRDVAQRALSRLERDRSTFLTDLASGLVQSLGKFVPRFEGRRYNRSTLTPGFTASGEYGPNPLPDLEALILDVQQEAKAPVNDAPNLAHSTAPILERTRALLGRTALSHPIENLTAAPPEEQRWVQQGLELHEHRDHCLFCLHEFTPERREALAAHFDASLKALQSEIATLQNDIGDEVDTLAKQLHDLPAEEALVDGLRAEYAKARKGIEDQLTTFRAGLTWAQAALDHKSGALFTAVDSKGVPEPVSLDEAELLAVLESHNAQVRSHKERQSSWADQVEAGTVHKNQGRFNSYVDEESDLTTQIAAARSSISGFESEIRNLEQGALDPQPLCDALNRDLEDYFLRQDLRFEPADGVGYHVLRQGQPAHHLSEGERTIIGLLFFLHSLHQHDTKLAETIVVVDDPVSSLDHSALIGISALLWSRLYGRCGQLFLMTHEFELFRLWATKLSRRAFGKPPKGLLFEILMRRHASGTDSIRRPHLEPWPETLAKKCLSEYHYLFAKVTRVASQDPGGPMEDDWAAANACRKLLESFLAFRYPKQIGDLTGAVELAGRDNGATELAERVIRFAHSLSHREDPDVFRHNHRPETVENALAVLAFMRKVDDPHVTRTLDAIAG